MPMDFNASYLEIEPRELVQYLLREAGQEKRDAVNPADFLSLLNLDFESFDFDTALPEGARGEGSRPRALLSFPDRIVAAHSALKDRRARFSVLHEIAHYVLPNHEHSFYLCDDQGLSFPAKLALEKEANAFAADLLFQADRFTLEANGQPISASTVKLLGDRYQASYEATARRLVERNLRPCMLVVCTEDSGLARVDLDARPVWRKKYCIASGPFRMQHFADLRNAVVPPEIVAQVRIPMRDLADSVISNVSVGGVSGKGTEFRAEFFFNQYNILCLLTPLNT